MSAPDSPGALGRPADPPRTDLSAAVYGSLLVTTLVAAQGRHDADTDFIAVTVAVSVGVFWLMETWSELVNLRVRGPITWAETLLVARDEVPMLTAAIVPIAVLVTHRFGIVTVDQAIAIALLVSIVQLFLWGLVVGRAIHRGWGVALVVAAVDCILGLLIVALKVLIVH